MLAGAPRFAGVEIGGTKLQVVLGPGDGTIAERWRADADRAGGGKAIRRQIAEGLRSLAAGRSLAGVGVGFGGPVDVATGRTRKSHQVAGWDDVPLRDWLAEQIGAPVLVENDSNTATLAEAIYGAGRGLDPVFYANFGSGVGGGLVAGGDIYHGRPPGEMEFGHLRLFRENASEGFREKARDGWHGLAYSPARGKAGPPMEIASNENAEHGQRSTAAHATLHATPHATHLTVEDCCSGWAVDRRIRSAIIDEPESTLTRLVGNTEGGESRHLAQALTDHDPLAQQILADVAGDIAFALSHVVHLLHPRVIVLGGGLSLVGEPFRAAVAGALPDFVMEAFHPTPEVRLAKLGEDAVPVGALELATRIAKLTS